MSTFTTPDYQKRATKAYYERNKAALNLKHKMWNQVNKAALCKARAFKAKIKMFEKSGHYNQFTPRAPGKVAKRRKIKRLVLKKKDLKTMKNNLQPVKIRIEREAQRDLKLNAIAQELAANERAIAKKLLDIEWDKRDRMTRIYEEAMGFVQSQEDIDAEIERKKQAHAIIYRMKNHLAAERAESACQQRRMERQKPLDNHCLKVLSWFVKK